MAQDIGYDFAAGPTITILSADVTDTNVGAITAAVDFGDPTPVAFGWELILTMGASSVDFVYLEISWAHANVAAQFADLLNLENVASVLCTASVDVEAVGAMEIKAQFAKFRLRNESGGTIDGTASNTALKLFDIFYNQV